MSTLPIYTSETMVTRALAAEIRHDPESFITFLQERTGIDSLGELESVRCESKANVDVELTFKNRAGYSLGIEAKFDHELTPQQINAELEVHGHLVLVLPSIDAVPRWLANEDRVSVMTWSEALNCFTDCRITDEDIASMPLSKLTVEILLHKLELQDRFPTDWEVRVKRTDGGLPAILMKSPWLPNGRMLKGQIQVSGQSMPAIRDDVRLNYSIGVAVDDDDEDFPDPTLSHDEPGWISSLRRLHQDVLDGHMDQLSVSRSSGRTPRGERGQRKLPLAAMHLENNRWLVKGYFPDYLGISSDFFTLDQLPELARLTVDIFTKWYERELDAANT